jgi:small-conductance mechanosensitive channel
MCPRLSDEWRDDANHKRRIHIFGPVAWYVTVALSAAAIIFFIAMYLVILFEWGGSGAWPVVAIMLASIGFVIAVPAALAWLSRKTRRTERSPRQSGHSVSSEPAGTADWLNSLKPQGDLPEHTQGDSQREAEHRMTPTRFQWVMLIAFIVVVLALMGLFRMLWIPDFGTP